MVYALLILIAGGLACLAAGLAADSPQRNMAARAIALLSVGSALVASLWWEGFAAGPEQTVTGVEIANWLGAPVFGGDALASGIGAGVLLFGLVALLKLGVGASDPPFRLAIGIALIAMLYSLCFTLDLRAFAAQVLAVVLLIWALTFNGRMEAQGRHRFSLGLAALLLLGAVLLIGRTTGGEYNLTSLPLSALQVWPLLLIVGWAALWLGLSPLTGWSAPADDGTGPPLHSLALGVPPVLLILRLQALITEGALAGSTPPEWSGAMSALAILGGLTAVVGGAATYLWSGTLRWRSAITAYWMGLVAWSLGLDNPTGRWAALALLASYAVGSLALTLAHRDPEQAEPSSYTWVTRAVAGLTLAGAPLSVGFIGIWLLLAGLVESHRPMLGIVLFGAMALAACGTALHVAQTGMEQTSLAGPAPAPGRFRFTLDLAGWVLAGLMLVGGVVPGLWLPLVEQIAGVAGRGLPLELPWAGLVRNEMRVPLTMMGVAVLVLGLVGRLMRTSATARMSEAGALLPTALSRLQGGPNVAEQTDTKSAGPFQPAAPAAVWWLSLIWLETGLQGVGTLVTRLASSAGNLLARFEGRYFLPLALLLTLLTLLAITR